MMKQVAGLILINYWAFPAAVYSWAGPMMGRGCFLSA